MNSIFWNMCKRDFAVYRQNVRNIIINEMIIRPFFFMFAFGYLMPRLSARPEGSQALFFIGTIIYVCTSLSFGLLFDVWYDMTNYSFSSFQLTRISSIGFVLQKIVCASLVLFLSLIPLFPSAQLLLDHPFPQLTLRSFPILLLLLMSVSVLIVSFVLFALLLIQHMYQIRFFWRRVVVLLANLGGVFLPFSIFAKVFPHASYIFFLNPFMYITEGARKLLIGGDFFNMPLVFSGLSVFTLIFFGLSVYQLRRRMDPVN